MARSSQSQAIRPGSGSICDQANSPMRTKVMPISTEKYRSTDISGDYAAMARAFGGYGERVTKPEDIIPAIQRGIQKTKEGIPVLLEFITSKEIRVSKL